MPDYEELYKGAQFLHNLKAVNGKEKNFLTQEHDDQILSVFKRLLFQQCRRWIAEGWDL